MRTLLAAVALSLSFASVAAPTVSLTAPTNGNLYLAPATFAVKANASASGVGINRVEFYANGVLIQTDTTSPYQFDWTGVTAGTYAITAKAVDNNGAETTTAARTVTVAATNTAPTVSLTAPADNARYLNPTSVALSANASGPELNDLLQRVDFYLNGTLAGTATSAPYTFSATGLALGSYTLTAVATDSQGAQTTSAPRTFVVSGTNVPPTVSIVTPLNNSRWHSPASFMFQANASSGEANDSVQVQFFVNGVLQGTDTTSPYSVNLSSLAAGTYTLMARAIDGQGAQVDSVTRTVIASDTNNPPTVSITSPTANTNYPTAPASFTLSATAGAGEVNGSVSRVEFYVNGALANTDTAGPFSFNVSGLANGTYVLTAKAVDQLNAETTSAPITVTVGAAPLQAYFIHTDHLNTPRLVADATGTTVWKWDQQEPFGVNVPDENPSGQGAFEFPMRFPGQYFDKETNLNYNISRDYDPYLAIYKQSDPIGLQGGANTYAYVLSHPLGLTDPTGLITAMGAYWHYCFGGGKPLTISYGEVGVSGVTATSFSSVAGVKNMPCLDAVISIADSKPYTTSGEMYLVLGDVTLKLNGLLYTSCDCSWNFAGTLSVADDFYNFNPSTHRSIAAEAATTLGRWGGKVCGSTPYAIKISGSQPISEGGRLNGKPTCCGAP